MGMEQYLQAWGAYIEGGVEALIPYVADDAVWEEYAKAPGAQVWHGREGVRGVYRRWQEDFEDFAFHPAGTPEEIAPDVFVIPVKVHGVGRGSGIEVDWDVLMVNRMRGGQVTRLFFADTLEEARARAS